MFIALAPETVLQNRYRIISRLDKPKSDGKGKGGMGAVYLAEDSLLSCEVAIKQTFNNDDADLTDELNKAFQREAKLLANLRHQSLPRVTNHFSEDNGQFLVMDLVRGEDLDDLRLRHGGRLPLNLALKLADQLLEVLHYLHKQNPPVIHRDIKPSNLKLTENEQLMLLDFGLAKGTLGLMTHHNHRSLFAMTEAYAPPEQIEGEITEARSDLFSFGATFYELLTGQTPPHALTKRAFEIAKKNPDPLRPVHELNIEVPKEISEIFTRTLSIDIEKRPRSATLLRQELSMIDGKIFTEETTVINKRKLATPNLLAPKNKPYQETFTDPRDGYSYKIVKLRDGNWWLAENLRYEMPIPNSFPADENPDEMILATNPDYDWTKYGRLYTWDAAQKASPSGWHLPSSREWKKMLKLYGHGEGLGNDKSTDDLKILVRDEMDMEFGGFIESRSYQTYNPAIPYAYGYFHGRMGGRFWSSSRATFPLKIRSGIYYRFFSRGSAGRDQENVEKAFSVRCVKD